MKILPACIFTLIVAMNSYSLPMLAQDMPDKNWQAVPLEAFKNTPDYHLRTAIPYGYIKAEGDFNGDGIADKAEISKNTVTGQYSLIAYISGQQGGFTQHFIETGTLSDFASLGVTTKEPGALLTWCGKQDDCKAGEPAEITLTNDAILLFTFESAGRLLVYENGSFQTVWISD